MESLEDGIPNLQLDNANEVSGELLLWFLSSEDPDIRQSVDPVHPKLTGGLLNTFRQFNLYEQSEDYFYVEIILEWTFKRKKLKHE